MVVTKRPTTGFRLGYHNVTLGTATILKHQSVVWYKQCFDISNRLSVAHLCDTQTDRQTDVTFDRNCEF